MIGEIKQDNIYLLLPSKVSRMADMLADKEHISLIDAIKRIYLSDTYRRLENEASKLWHWGPVDLYHDLASELGAAN